MRGLEPPRLAAPDPKSVFELFSSFLKSLHFASKDLYLGVLLGYRIFIILHHFSLFFIICSKKCSKKIEKHIP